MVEKKTVSRRRFVKNENHWFHIINEMFFGDYALANGDSAVDYFIKRQGTDTDNNKSLGFILE